MDSNLYIPTKLRAWLARSGQLAGLVLFSFALGWGCSTSAEPTGAAAIEVEPLSAPTIELTSESANTSVPVFPTSSIEPLFALQATPTPLPETHPPAVPEERLLTLEWPTEIKVGDAEIVRLTLEIDSEGDLTPTPYLENSELRSEPIEIPNLYETHLVNAEARLDLAGVQYVPEGIIIETLLPGEPVIFLWSVRPIEVGTYDGTVWLHLRFIPKDGGQEYRSVLTAQLIEIQAVNFLGLGGTAARILGIAGVAVGSILSLDKFLSWIWRLISGLGVFREKPGA